MHKKGRYYIVHFKCLFALDGKETDLDPDDVMRQNLIAGLLEDWGLVQPIETIDRKWREGLTRIKVIRHSEKDNWTLVPKYNLGKIKAREIVE